LIGDFSFKFDAELIRIEFFGMFGRIRKMLPYHFINQVSFYAKGENEYKEYF